MIPELFDDVTVEFDRADFVTENDKDVWNEEYLSVLNEAGFSMKGGIYIGLRMIHRGETISWDYVAIARRVEPMKREATCIQESSKAEFMHHCAFRNPFQGSANWGADFVNTIIGEHEGSIPDTWLNAAMDGSKVMTLCS